MAALVVVVVGTVVLCMAFIGESGNGPFRCWNQYFVMDVPRKEEVITFGEGWGWIGQ